MAKFLITLAALALAVFIFGCSTTLADNEGYVLARHKRQMDCYKMDSYSNGEIYRTSCTSFCFYHGYWPRCNNGHCTCAATPEAQPAPQPSTLPIPNIPTLPIPSPGQPSMLPVPNNNFQPNPLF